MSMICIPIPDLQRHHTVGLQITVDGVRRVMNYRVEVVPWPAEERPELRIEMLRTYIDERAPDWELVQIGPPDRDRVPVTFRQHVSMPLPSAPA